jgi:hypothetical protein
VALMARVRRRAIRERRGLTRAERRTLLGGGPCIGLDGTAPWWRRVRVRGTVEWQPDPIGQRRAWQLHREELVAEAAERGLIPWAAREFEGMPGRTSPYEGEDPRIGGRHAD